MIYDVFLKHSFRNLSIFKISYVNNSQYILSKKTDFQQPIEGQLQSHEGQADVFYMVTFTGPALSVPAEQCVV